MSIAERIEKLRTKYDAPLVLAAKFGGKYDLAVTSGGSMEFLFGDVDEVWADAFVGGLEAGLAIGGSVAPKAAAPRTCTAIIPAGDCEVIFGDDGPRGDALYIELYQVNPPHAQITDAVTRWRTNGGRLGVRLDAPVPEDFLVRVTEC